MIWVGRVLASLLGLALLAAAFAAEFERALILPAVQQAPALARGLVELALATGYPVHVTAGALGAGGLIVMVSAWPVLMIVVAVLARLGASALGLLLIAVAAVAALDPTFLGVFDAGPPAALDEDGGGGGGVVIYAAAAVLGCLGLALVIVPWRRWD
jgi:hypothetical protein